MTLLDLMKTPPERKALIFEIPEIFAVPCVNPAKEAFDNIVQKESESVQETAEMPDEMNSELKEHAKKFEDKLVKDMLKIPRTKRSAKRLDVVSRKLLATRGRPPLAPKSKTVDKQAGQKEERLPDIVATEQAEAQTKAQPKAASTQVYARKFPEKLDATRKHSEVPTYDMPKLHFT